MAVNVQFEGSPAQQQILRDGWVKLKFPWDKLTRYPTLTVGWDDLNDGSIAPGPSAKSNNDHQHEGDQPPHIHVEHPTLGTGHAVSRKEDKRWRIAGVFWTNGRIYIDVYYESRPEIAHAILGAEAAHFVDYGLPYTADHKRRINNLLHSGDPNKEAFPHGHPSWWEINSYSSEYYTLPGEANMDLWVFAYSDMNPGQWPNHPSTEAMGTELRKILNIPRTDETTPVPVPTPTSMAVYQIRGYRKYHRNASTLSNQDDCRYIREARGKGKTITNGGLIKHASQAEARAKGLTPCGVCRPG